MFANARHHEAAPTLGCDRRSSGPPRPTPRPSRRSTSSPTGRTWSPVATSWSRSRRPPACRRSKLRVLLNGTDVTKELSVAGGKLGGLVTNLKPRRQQADRPGAGRRREQPDDRQPPERRPRVLRSAGPAVEVPGRRANDAQCNQPTTYAYEYMSSVTGELQAYDPENPPRDVANTTTRPGQDRAVHRPHRDRLPGPRPVQDRASSTSPASRGAAGRRSRSRTTSC